MIARQNRASLLSFWRAALLVASLLPNAACALSDSGAVADAAATAPPAPSAVHPSLAPPQSAGALVGTTAEHVRAEFGPPALRRDEGDAEIWLYASANGCRVNLVLTGQGGDARVAFAAAHRPAHTTEAACLRALSGPLG